MAVAWGAAAVDATEGHVLSMSPDAGPAPFALGMGILAAALALPGIQCAHAETAPERGLVAYKHLDYEDSQPGWDRIDVEAHAVRMLLPVAGKWLLDGSVTRDVVSGASPSFHTSRLRAGAIEEERDGWDLQVTRYFARGTLAVGITDSGESDYTSRGYAVTGSISSESRNTTLNLGLATTRDRIDAPWIGVRHEPKNADEWLLGVTQILTAVDIVQLSYTRYDGDGYYSDPYKFRDHRPDAREQDTVMVRWNHHCLDAGGTVQASYRFYSDSFDVSAHTIALEYVQPLPDGWTITPIVRLYAQSAADFYLDPRYPGVPTIRPRDEIQSQDQRLSSFAALTYGLKIGKQLGPDWLVDLRYERYEQDSDWTPFGAGSPGIEPLHASWLQFGIEWSF